MSCYFQFLIMKKQKKIFMFLNALDVSRTLHERWTATEIPISKAREGSVLTCSHSHQHQTFITVKCMPI